jgi:aspartokinase-like uncharacterized kinase
VTSDSIAAWVAGRLCARLLILVKAPGVGSAAQAVDGYFASARPAGLSISIISADRIDDLKRALNRE